MHSKDFGRSRFHYNSDYSGRIKMNSREGESGAYMSDLLQFIYHWYINNESRPHTDGMSLEDAMKDEIHKQL